MTTAWDRAATGYAAEWMPRFVPYHHDLLTECTLHEGQRVLVTSAGPGAEAIAVARAVGDKGHVRATDASAAMVELCRARVEKAAFTNVTAEVADALDVSGGPYDVVCSAFGLWQLSDRVAALRAWRGALTPRGKVAVIAWGPPDGDDPFERMSRILKELEPDYDPPSLRELTKRDSMEEMFHEAGLAMVRHTIVSHTMSFPSADAFVAALRESSSWRRIYEELGEARFARVGLRFCAEVGGAEQPLAYDPPATLAIAALPGAEVELHHRPSVRAPGP